MNKSVFKADSEAEVDRRGGEVKKEFCVKKKDVTLPHYINLIT